MTRESLADLLASGRPLPLMAGAQSAPPAPTPTQTQPKGLSFVLPGGNQQAAGAVGAIGQTIERDSPYIYSTAVIECRVSGSGSIGYQILDGIESLTDCADPNGAQTSVSAGAGAIFVTGLRPKVSVRITSTSGTVNGVVWTFFFFQGPRPQEAGDLSSVNQGTAGSSTSGWYVQPVNSSGNAIFAGPTALTDGLGLPTTTEVGSVLLPQTSDNVDVWRRGKLTEGAQASASGDTAVHTPTSGKKARVLKGLIEIGGNATLAVAGVLTVKLRDGTTAIPGLAWELQVPAAAVTGVLATIPFELDQGYLSSAANNVINVNLSSALASGHVNVLLQDSEE